MSNIAIKAENLSKAYQLGEIGTGTISRDLERWYARIRGKEDPFLRIGETNDRTAKGTSDIVWSLKDINFEIEQGDAVGIIGRNGAGKSTLLKVLSRVTSPTSGRITGKGRIASLLEVGTGFHPELTGRENIYLNGAILGMRKKEITRKFDEIVDFAGVERYIDTPVKRYSSGMYVRLAFAVAAHLESEILIVDEVLAVGDAEFQKKCLGKMNDVSKGEGRTVLFVSHNMGSVQQLCNKGIILQNGSIGFIGEAAEAARKYQTRSNKYFVSLLKPNYVSKNPELIDFEIDETKLKENCLSLSAKFQSPFPLNNPSLGVVISDYMNNPILGTNPRIHPTGYENQNLSKGQLQLTIPNLPLMPGAYNISLYFGDSMSDYTSYIDITQLHLTNTKIDLTKLPDTKHIGSVRIDNVTWKLNK